MNEIRKVVAMTKGTKIFIIIICVLLALTMGCSAFFSVSFLQYIDEEVKEKEFGIYVAGVPVTRSNKDDILDDGTVHYDSYNNILTFENATIESENVIVFSMSDLNIELIGENKFICTSEDYSFGISAADNNISQNLTIMGDGSLTIDLPNTGSQATGIFASDILILSDVTVTTPDCENQVYGIVCDSSLQLAKKATVTVNNGASKYSSAVRVRGNALFEQETTLKVSTTSSTSGVCKGLNISGDLFLGKDSSLDVSVDDKSTDSGECIRISGLMEIGSGSTVKASAKNAHAIECFGTIEANEGASIYAVSDKKEADIFCSGAVVNCGATIDAEIDAIGGIHNRD